MTSINKLLDTIWTIESQAYSSAVNLIQEIKNCEKTPLGIVKELIPGYSQGINMVYADNYFNHYAYHMKGYNLVEEVITEAIIIINPFYKFIIKT